ncbi:MAG TPA: winged helix-turn-helix domain-containing protein [Solirubrobacterales bacterium]|jgi:transposase|nr:winged helix-turn-helix domain-containing protein [Solirubrobacterales bacterium]
MGNPAGIKRNFDALERRRLRAFKLLKAGVSQAEVARRVGVHRQSVSRWAQAAKLKGKAALLKAGRAGRLPRLSATQKEQIKKALLQGPQAHGYATGLWTIGRVALLIERQTGCRYHPGHVWRLLRSFGWSSQRPTGRALERDEKAIARWKKQDWPRIKKKP